MSAMPRILIQVLLHTLGNCRRFAPSAPVTASRAEMGDGRTSVRTACRVEPRCAANRREGGRWRNRERVQEMQISAALSQGSEHKLKVGGGGSLELVDVDVLLVLALAVLVELDVVL